MLPAVRGMGKHLVIAPPSDLEYAGAEVQRIANAIGATLLIDNVTLRTVLDALRTPWDSIWFVGHGDLDGIRLGDTSLTASMLVQALRQSPPALVVINTCESIHIATRLHEIGTAVICTITKVTDAGALVTNVRLAEELAAGADVTTAYERSRPDSNVEYLLLNGRARLNGQSVSDDTNRLVLQVYNQLGQMHDELRDLRRNLQRTSPQVVAWIFAWLCLFAPVGVFLNLENVMDITTSPAFSWAGLCWVLSAVLFAYAFGFFKEY